MGHGPEPAIDFGKLNAAERTALSLLAQGHTAKSIAALTDRSVGAVNERLREARRKTGAGSSRELARLFAAQENRDELIGLAPAVQVAPDPAPPAARGRLWTGATSMSLILGGALTAAFFIASQGQGTRDVVPSAGQPAAATSNGPGDPTYRNAAYWHKRVAGEQRDDQWAPEAENALRARLTQVAGLDTGDHPLRIFCATTACEVTGVLSGDDQRKSTMLDEVQTVGSRPDSSVPPLTMVSFEVIVDNGKAPSIRMHFQRGDRPG